MSSCFLFVLSVLMVDRWLCLQLRCRVWEAPGLTLLCRVTYHRSGFWVSVSVGVGVEMKNK